jgi:hypothetical protein
MSELGQTEKYPARADVVRCSSNNGRCLACAALRGLTEVAVPCFADPILWNTFSVARGLTRHRISMRFQYRKR